uniref:Prolyl-tRNA synthetase n=1 Tax=Romanomermis culicivorax TaxID=13658 RepID=A0A915I7C8_ROMCU
MSKLKTIEIGHTFLLGTKYSSALNAFFSSGLKFEKSAPFYMACFGIGVSRLLAAGVDFMIEKSSQQKELRWPRNLAPYNLCLIPPKRGSREETAGAGDFAQALVENLYGEFGDVANFNLLYDDRNDLTVGRRLNDAKCLGCPFIIVANKTCVGPDIPKVELFSLNQNSSIVVSHAELFGYLRENLVPV